VVNGDRARVLALRVRGAGVEMLARVLAIGGKLYGVLSKLVR
jgi:hypothetical protein